MAKIKRSQFRTFLNTGTILSPTWTLLNTGIAAGKISYAPKTTEETWIHEDTASISVDSYSPGMPIDMSITNAEAAFEFLDALRKSRATLSSAETEVVNVYLYKGVCNGLYLAEKQSVTIQFDKFGGPGGSPAKLNYTIGYIGNPTRGLFNLSAFTPMDETAWLSSLVIGSGPLVLSPAFKSKRIWYTAPTANATDTITAVAVDGNSVITIDLNNGTPVVNGVAATWDEGLNTLLITSTLGAVTAKYVVLVTLTTP